MNQPIIIFGKRSRQLFLSFMALFMVLLSIFGIVFYQSRLASAFSNWILYVFGWLGVFVFGFSLIFFLKQALAPNPRPILTVDDNGVTDHSSAIAIGFIPWEDIRFIHLQSYLNQTYISVTLVDNTPYLAKMNWFQQQTCKSNLKMGLPLVNILLNSSSHKPQIVYYNIISQYGDKFMKRE